MGREPEVVARPGAERWSIFADFIAGGLAGICCDTMLHPIDTVKSHLHMQKGPPYRYRSMFHAFAVITRQEGRKGLYAGFGAVLTGSVPAHAVMFGSYKACKRLGEKSVPEIDDKSTESGTPVPIETQLLAVDLASGAVGGLFALPFYVPAEVIAKRMQVASLGIVRNYNSVAHAAQCIYRTEGGMGLLTGFWATLLRDIPFAMLELSLFSICKDKHREYTGRSEVNGLEAATLGVIVGAISAVLTNPFDVVKTRFMVQGTGAERKYNSIMHCMRRMISEEGVSSLTRGALARVLWVAPATGITLAVYERTSKFLKKLWCLEEPGDQRQQQVRLT